MTFGNEKEGYYYISESGITTLNDVKIVSSGIDGLWEEL